MAYQIKETTIISRLSAYKSTSKNCRYAQYTDKTRPKSRKEGITTNKKTDLLFNGGSLKICRELLLLGLKTFTTLLEQALFSFALPDLNQVVLSPAAAFVSIDGNLVSVPTNLRPITWP